MKSSRMDNTRFHQQAAAAAAAAAAESEEEDEEEEEEASATFSPSQLLHLAETHLRLRNFSLCRQYSLELLNNNHHPNNNRRASQLISISDILSSTNSYSALQLDTFSTNQTLIHSHFKRLSRLLEDSVNAKLPFAQQALISLRRAFETLSDPPRKARLDAHLLSQAQMQHDVISGDANKEDCFWTFCPYCFYVYQYARVYEGCCLRCQNGTCRRVFHGVALCSLPKMELDKGEYFGCFGYFPIGFSPEGEGEGGGNGKGKFESWSPIVGLFPVRRVDKTRDDENENDVNNNINNNNDAHCVEIMDESDESEATQHEGAGVEGVKGRMMRKKTVAWNAKKSMMGGGRRGNEGGERSSGGGYGNEDEASYGFGDMHDVGMGSGGCEELDADDVKFFEEDGEIFVGLSPDDAL